MDTVEPDYVEPEQVNDSRVYGSTAAAARGTLDESILSTFQRDFYEINDKLKKVVYPNFPLGSISTADQHVFQGTDVWAPLCFIILYSVFSASQHGSFAAYFIMCWLLISVMATHLKLLRPHEAMSWMSYLSLSGYCLFPQVLNSLICIIILPLTFRKSANVTPVRLVVLGKILSFVLFTTWSIVSVTKVTNAQSIIERYPLSLCLVVLGWLSVVH